MSLYNSMLNCTASQILNYILIIQHCKIYNIRRYSPEYTLWLCRGYNYATCPGLFRNEKEHKACGKLAKYCKKRLKACVGWYEDDEGKMRM